MSRWGEGAREWVFIPTRYAPGDRVVLNPEHIARVGNLGDQGDFGPRARGTVVEIRWRGSDPVLVVEWDGGSCRNHHPRSLWPVAEGPHAE